MKKLTKKERLRLLEYDELRPMAIAYVIVTLIFLVVVIILGFPGLLQDKELDDRKLSMPQDMNLTDYTISYSMVSDCVEFNTSVLKGVNCYDGKVIIGKKIGDDKIIISIKDK